LNVLAVVTREIFWNVPIWARVLMYALFVASAAICAFGVVERVRAWRRGRPSRPRNGDARCRRERFVAGCRRLWSLAVLQVKIRRDRLAGVSHHCVFWGFVVLFIGTCIVGVEEYGAWLLGREHLIFVGPFYIIVSCALEVFGLAFIVGLVIAGARRYRQSRYTPLKRPTDLAVVVLFLAIGVTGFVTEGVRIAAADGGMSAHEFEKWSFVGWLLALAFRPLDESTARAIHLVLWLVHMALSMLFVAFLPYCKLRHVLFAPLWIAIGEPRRPGKYTGVSMEDVEETGSYGVGVASEFTRRQLASFDACTECARCQSMCPATTTGKPLSPMRVVLDVAWTSAYEDAQKSLHGDVISADMLWACTSCGACVDECPVGIDQLGAIVDLRRHLVGEGEIRGSAQAALRSTAASGNPWGMPQDERAAWAKELEADGIRVPTIDDEPEPEILYWVGCAGSYDRRGQKVARAMAKILDRSGLRWAILGKKERCTGDPARRLGDEFTYLELATANVETIQAAKATRIVAACPHCFNTLSNEYPDLGGDFEVVHHTVLIEELIAAGKITVGSADDDTTVAGRKVAFHDPCYLARQNAIVNAPRTILGAAGTDLVEPELSRERGFCCGAGGGRMWMEEDAGSRVNEERFRQLRVLNPDVVAVGCPFCMTMMQDAAAASGDEGEPEVFDVAEIVAARLE